MVGQKYKILAIFGRSETNLTVISHQRRLIGMKLCTVISRNPYFFRILAQYLEGPEKW